LGSWNAQAWRPRYSVGLLLWHLMRLGLGLGLLLLLKYLGLLLL
jgi:hypothetical protein